jgi:hypothetical protein
MRTTVRLNDQLLDRARKEARKKGTTLTALIEEGLTLVIGGHAPAPAPAPIRLPVSRATGGTLPGVDLSNSADLLDRLEGRS